MFRFSILLHSIIIAATAYKILVYSPQVSHSHVSFMGQLADTLAEAGHNVTVFLPAFHENVTTTGVKHATAIVSPRRFNLGRERIDNMNIFWKEDGDDPRQILLTWQFLAEMFAQLCQSQFEDQVMMSRLRKENFDLGIGEIFDMCSLPFIEAVGIKKHIAALSSNIIEAFVSPFGIDSNPSYVPAAFSPLSDEMTYFERARNLGTSIITSLLFRLVAKPKMDNVFHRYISKDFNLDDLIARSTFAFINSEDFTEFSRPINKKIVFVGGIGVKKPRKLPEEFQKIMDNAAHGAVFVSFGSVMQGALMPKEMKEAFIGAFRSFPEITFIWKYELDDDVASDLPNLVKTKWAPQNDLFGHPSMRAFVSHSGMNSITECTHAGIPVVTIPLYGDQMRNSKIVEKLHVGVTISKHNVTAQSLTDALSSVLHDKSYWNAAKRLAEMIRKKPMSAKERVVKYTEFAAEFGHVDNLDSAAVKLNFFQYYLLDVIIPIVALLSLTVFLFTRLLVYLARKAFNVIKVKTE